MALAHFRMLFYEFLSKYLYIVLEEPILIILDSKSSVCMDNNGKDIKHIRHITRRIHLLRNGDKYKMHKIGWCEGGLQLADIATSNFGKNDLSPRMKYIMVRLEK